jgi:hypothetical protein
VRLQPRRPGATAELVLLPATEHGFDAVYGGFANQIAQARVDRSSTST